MGRKGQVPKYRLHKASGQALVRLNGHDHYLGLYGTQESKEKYQRLIGEWLAGHGSLSEPSRRGDISVSALILAYMQHAEQHYRHADGTPTTQLDRVRRALGWVRTLYGPTPAREFGPLALKAVRQQMLEQGYVRRSINQRVGCVVLAFKWAVAEELLPASVWEALRSVPGLRQGRCTAPESPSLGPVPEPSIEAVRALLVPILQDVLDLQLLTAMRPGEALRLREPDLEMSGAVWLYRPASHKTQHHGKVRVIFLGPKAQAVLGKYLWRQCPHCGRQGRNAEVALGWNAEKGCCGVCHDYFLEHNAFLETSEPLPERVAPEYLFSPEESVPASLAGKLAGSKERLPGACYLGTSYSQAIRRACKKAGVPAFHPHLLRHTAATAIQRQFDVEVARIICGHASIHTTEEFYLQRDLEKAMRVIREIG